MSMMFGGWYKEDEDIVNSEFGGDWAAFYKWREVYRIFVAKQEPKDDNSVQNISSFDIIGTWDNEENIIKNEFHVEEIKDGQIFGRFLDGRYDAIYCKYPYDDFVKKHNAITDDFKHNRSNVNTKV